MSVRMKKSFLLLSLGASIILASCSGFDGLSSGGDTSSSVTTGGNTLTSVLSSLGNNLTVSSSFPFISGGSTTPGISAAYIAQGNRVSTSGFTTTGKTGGIVYVGDGKKAGVSTGSYKWTEETPNVLTLGDQITGSLGDTYYTPSMIGQESSAFVAGFVPEISGTTNGFFDLSDATLLEKLSKYLGVYDTIASAGVTLDHASLYFSATGVQYTFTFFCKYLNGYSGLKATAIVSNVGTTTIQAINDYFAPSLSIDKTTMSLVVGGAADTITITADAGSVLTVTNSKEAYCTAVLSGNIVTVTPLAAVTSSNNPFSDGKTTKRATLTIRAASTDGFYREATCIVTLAKA